MAQKLLALGEQFADGRVAFLLEGGYDLAGLRDSTAAVLDALQDVRDDRSQTLNNTQGRIQPLLRRIRQVHEKYQ
jgi:acetoin utilization deacetylase AcuC-like enzyme